MNILWFWKNDFIRLRTICMLRWGLVEQIERSANAKPRAATNRDRRVPPERQNSTQSESARHRLHMSAHVCESDRRSETPRHLWWLRLVGISGRPDGEPFSWTLHEAQRSCQPHFLDPKRASTCERYTMVIHWHMDHTVHPPSLVWHIFSLNQLNPWGWVFWGLWRSVLRAKKPKTLGLWKSPSCSTRQTRQTPSCTQFASTFSQTASLLHYPMHIQSLQKTSMELRAILRAIRESKWCGDKFHAGLGENRSNHVLHCLEVRK